MMELWSGRGDAEGKAYWTKDSGEIVGLQYVTERAAQRLAQWRSLFSLETRRAVLDATVRNELWVCGRRGMTVGAVARDVESELLRWQATAVAERRAVA